MNKKKNLLINHLIICVKAFCIGGTMVVPGVSGGTMAVILGIFDQLITSISSFLRHKKESIILLAEFTASALVGIWLLTKPVSFLLERFPIPMMYLFVGAVAGGIPMIIRKSKVKNFSWAMVGYLILGIAIIVMLELLPDNTFSGVDASGIGGFAILIGAGFAAAFALILPGISISYMLLVLGLYENVMNAIISFDIIYLLPLIIGLLFGMLLLTRILERVMREHPSATYITILGFIIGSVAAVFPGIPAAKEILPCILLAAVGFFAVFFISKKGVS